MNGKDLLAALSHIEEAFVDEAETQEIRKSRPSPWLKRGSMAACLCLLLLGAFAANRLLPPNATDVPNNDALVGVIPEAATTSPSPASEAPDKMTALTVDAILLQVDSVTDTGFTGTVAEAPDSGVFSAGTVLHVVLEEDESAGTRSPDTNTLENQWEGSLVLVRLRVYDPQTQTIYGSVVSLPEGSGA